MWQGEGVQNPNILRTSYVHGLYKRRFLLVAQYDLDIAGFCRMPVSWEYRGRPGHHICIVKIDNRVVCTATAEKKQEARDEAARQTLEKLMQRCYTVAVKDKFVTDGTTVNADDVQVWIRLS